MNQVIWDDSDEVATDFVGRDDLFGTFSLTNTNSTYSATRNYTTKLEVLPEPTAPYIEGLDEFERLEIDTETDLSLTTRAVTEGTFTPATATFDMS